MILMGKTMRVKWGESCVVQAFEHLETAAQACNPDRAYDIGGQSLTGQDLQCLLDIVRQCDSQHSPVREQLLAALPDEWDTDQPTLADVADAVRDKLQRRTADCERVLEALLPVLREHPLSKDDVQGDNLRAGDIAKAAAEALQWQTAEIDRLTAEVERLRQEQTEDLKTDRDRYKAAHESTQRGLVRMEVQRDEARTEVEAIRGALVEVGEESIPSHVTALQAVEWLISEHRGQVKHNEEVGDENRALCNERDEWKRAAEAETQGRRAEVSRLREQLETAREVLERVGCQFGMCTGPVAEPVDMRTCFVCELLGRWGVSSSEAEAPQPTCAHEVAATTARMVVLDVPDATTDLIASNVVTALHKAGLLSDSEPQEARSATSETSIARTRPPYPYEARQWAEEGARVECFSGRDPSHVVHEGWIIGMTEAPTVRVQKDDGQIVSWVLGITRRQDAQKADRG